MSLSHEVCDALLVAAGEPGDALLRLVLFPDVQTWTGQRIPDAVPGLREAAERYPSTVREALQTGGAKSRAHATEQLSHCGLSPLAFFDVVAPLAVDSAKSVREAAEAWLGSAPEEVLPLVEAFA
jgi:hypothetical protein